MGDASNETEWAADRKVGFAMGILLIGVVAALFFRNEPLAITDTPTVAREELIDSRLRDRNVEVYVDEAESGSLPTAQAWKNSEFLEDYSRQNSGVALPILPSASAAGTTSQTSGSESPGRLDIRPPTPTVPKTPLEDSVDLLELADLPDVNRLPPPGNQFDEYTIRYGDTLSGIADRMLGSPSRYTDIYNANKDRMASPDRLQVGAAIRIPRH
jgi:hypothetical protein